jgi:hypothetical protein
MRRGIFCWTELDSVRWAFDGVSDQLVPACRECCERLHAKVWRVDPGGGQGPARAGGVRVLRSAFAQRGHLAGDRLGQGRARPRGGVQRVSHSP